MGLCRVVDGGNRNYLRVVQHDMRVVVAAREPCGCGRWRVHVPIVNIQHVRYGG